MLPGTNVRITAPAGDGYGEVTTTDMGTVLDRDTLVGLLLDRLRGQYGTSFALLARQELSDGRTRADYRYAEGGTEYTARLIVGQQGTVVHLLTLIATTAAADGYAATFQRMQDSYQTPR